MNIAKKYFGRTQEGKTAYIFTLENSNKMIVRITNYGGIVVSIKVPDNKGRFDDVVLGFDGLDGYLKHDLFFGAIVGRHANRIENAEFEINGEKYNLTKNEGENHIHGGIKCFSKVLWDVSEKSADNTLELTYLSKDGEEGYPGNLQVKVTYTLTEDNELKIDYYAVSDKDTVVNLTNHSYFNLSGRNFGFNSILKHKLYINADKFTVNDKNSLPTGEIRDVSGTPMDFTEPKEIGKEINDDYDQLVLAKGYDHNWILNDDSKPLKKAAEAYEEKSGRVMEVFTTKPGMQFYSGNYIYPLVGKHQARYDERGGFCLETQYFPNSLKHKNFPSPILKAEEEYKHTTIYKFSVR